MKAVVYTSYGSPDGLRLQDVRKPSPKDDQVLVKVHATCVNATDLENLRGTFMVRVGAPVRPKYRILGSDIAGRVEAVGRNVKRFQPGDAVFGDLSPLQGRFGAFAEYVCAHQDTLASKPPGLTFEEAAASTSTAILALQALHHKGKVQPGQRVLINGAAGGVGTFAVQIAKAYGAEVTGVDSAPKQDLLRRVGADHVIDYREEDFTRTGRPYDRILDVVSHRSATAYRRALENHGLCILIGGSIGAFLQAAFLGPWNSMKRGKEIALLTSWRPNKPDDVQELIRLIETGTVEPIIDRSYRLDEIPEAMRYLGSGHARGKVVIRV